MTRLDTDTRWWALLLIVGGALLLATEMGWLGWAGDWFWGPLFLAGGGFFLYQRISHHDRWWALIPAAALTALGVAVLAGAMGGPYFLGILGLGFGAVFATDPRRWWALIPAGTLLSLAVVAGVDVVSPRVDSAWILFLGLAATFWTLYLLPRASGGQSWAVYPALGLTATLLIVALTGAVTGYLFPAILIAAGAYLLWRRGGAAGGTNVPPRGV